MTAGMEKIYNIVDLKEAEPGPSTSGSTKEKVVKMLWHITGDKWSEVLRAEKDYKMLTASIISMWCYRNAELL